MPNSIDLLTNTTGLAIADKLDRQNAILAAIAGNGGGLAVDSWTDVRQVARLGLADKVFAVGDQLTCSRGEDTLTWDIVNLTATEITLLMHDCYKMLDFSAQQALYYAETALAAGNYSFTDGSNSYHFTLAQGVPVGGQIVLSGSISSQITERTVSTFSSGSSSEPIESNVTVATYTPTPNDGVTALVGANDVIRAHRGSGNYRDSAIRQWLNSDAAAGSVWTSKTVFDRPPVWAGTEAGFLNGLDADFLAVVSQSTVRTALSGFDGGGYCDVTDKFFLPSISELYGDTTGTVEGEAFAYYSRMAAAPTTISLSGRIKYNGGTAVLWYSRSPTTTLIERARAIDTSGKVASMYGVDSRTSYSGIAPACKIS